MNLDVPADEAGVRIDQWLSLHLPELSRARVQALLKSGHITADGCPVKSHAKTVSGMHFGIHVPPPTPAIPVAEDIPLDILHEDGDIVVVNKPMGLVVHPAAGHATGTLVNALLHHCQDLAGVGGERRPGIVHRLDKDTTGVMVVAKNEVAMQHLARQFKSRELCKEYLAIVVGCPVPRQGRIETLIGRSRHDRKKMSARAPSGRRSVTNYEVVESFGSCSLLRVVIETGRTHQIRVHMAHIGHPVVGDRQYGGRGGVPGAGDGPEVRRQMLHAASLTLRHPRTGECVTFSAPVPGDIEGLLTFLRASGAGASCLTNARSAPTISPEVQEETSA